jgi:ATP-dependent exoDNAse (exonuclease V) beta subunit
MNSPKAFNVYRSSAGSGKTYTLVKEYLRLALASSNANSFRFILAITFTNKAAEEMKNRVLETLREISRLDKDKSNQLRIELAGLLKIDEQTIAKRAAAMLQSMLHNYSDLAISTIDKFVHRLVRSFSRDLLLSHDFEVDTDTGIYLEEAISRLVQQVGKSPEITKTLIDFVSEKIENDASWQIHDLLKESGKKILDREGVQQVKALSEFDTTKFAELNVKVSGFLATYEHSLVSIAKKALTTIADAGMVDDDFYYKGKGIGAYFRKIAMGDINAAPNTYVKQTIDLQNFSSSKKEPRADSLAMPLTEMYRTIESYRAVNQPNYDLCAELKKFMPQLSLLSEINKSLQQVKEENNLIFIDDFHQKISDVVKDEPSPFIYERIGNKYRYLLIDEFQDTSVLQWHNFLPLVEHALSENHFVLLVGDGKQAIYRFRGGEVEQFDRLPDVFGHQNDPALLEKAEVLKMHYHHKNLPSNYRSLGKIVEFNNHLYEHLKTQLPADLASIYNDQSQMAVRPAEQGLVSVHFIEPKNEQDGSIKKSDALALEKLKLLSTYLNECKADGFEFGDVCIIVRGRKEGALVANYLSENNIPVISDESLLVASHSAVKLLHAALRHLAQSGNHQHALSLLIQLARVYSPDKINDVLSKHTKRENNKLISVNIRAFLAENDVKWSEKQLLTLPLYDLVETLVRDFKPINQSSAHLSFFKQSVLQFTNKKSNDIAAFLEWWEEKIEKMSISTPDETDAVQIMTIHKSKGLQFPVVILPFCDWNFKSRKNNVHWVNTPPSLSEEIDCEIPPAMLSQLGKNIETTPLAALAQQENDRIILDNLNLLYVATTRAQERLYIFSIFDPSDKEPSNIKHWLSNYASGCGWFRPLQRFGEPQSPQRKKKESSGIINTEMAVNEGWSDKIKINLEAGEWLDGNILSSQRARGKMMHRLMAELSRPEELTALVEDYISKGMIDPQEAVVIAAQIKELLQLPETKEWFALGAQTLNEKAIITPDGATYRPDRIILNEKEALVIDFKTGAADQSHHKQIMQYGDLLNAMGYHCRLQLAYLETPKVISVALNPQTSLF